MQRTYLAIDLKSYYASAECAARHLDPLTTNLVVADSSRTEKTICLAVSPSLKAYGIPGRARLFEVVQKVPTGFMQPTSITWSDGRTFPIETVRDFRPAGTADNGYSGDCFTVLIQGQEKHLFFEHLDPRFNGRLGRWFVERAGH